jgi:iron complex outermembrane recepter protein
MPLGLALLALTIPAAAQVAPQTSAAATPSAAPKPIPTEEKVTVLSPFEVRTEKDYGYLATNTLSGTRINTQVKDVGSQISIFNKDFINDIGATNVEELMGYAIGAQRDFQQEGSETNANQSGLKSNVSSFRVRGLLGVGRARNYFPWPGAEIDFSTTDRVDFTRGPNSILFGLGSPAGIFNIATKRADTTKNFANFELRTSNFGQRRASADINAISKDKRLAVRVVPLFDHSGTWRDHEYRNREGLYGAVTYNPTRTTTVRADFERARVDNVLGRTYTALDGTSYWENVGSPVLPASAFTVTTNPTTGITAATPTTAFAGQQVSGFITEATRTLAPAGSYVFVFNPANGYAANWATFPTGSGPLYNAGATSFALGADGRISNDPKYALNRIPRTATLIGSKLPTIHDFTTGSVFLEQRFTPNLVAELAYNRTIVTRTNYDIGWNFTSLSADGSSLLPDGRANPNAGRYFLESNVAQNYSDQQDDNLRATLSYSLDLNRRNKWLGRYSVAGLVERRDVHTSGVTSRETIYQGSPLPGNTVADVRNSVFRRAYVDLNNPDTLQFPDFRATPVNGVLDASRGVRVTAGMIPISGASERRQITDTRMFVGQAYLLQDYVVGTFGKRKDKLRQTNFDTQLSTIGDLTNIPSAKLNPNLVDRFAGDTETKGVVVHPRKWLSLYYNQSTNFNIQSGGSRVVSANPVGSALVRTAPNAEGRGKDYGVRLNGFWGDRVHVTFNKYENTGENFVGGTGAAYNGRIRNLIYSIFYQNAAALSGTSLVEAFNTVLNTQNNTITSSTFARASEGTEIEVTANLTRQWRMAIAYTKSKTITSNVAPEIRGFIKAYDPVFTRADIATLRFSDPNTTAPIGGNTLGNAGMPLPDVSAVPVEQQRDYFDNRGTSAIGVAGAIGLANTIAEQWQRIQDQLDEDNLWREGQRPVGEVPEQYSVRTNYTFTGLLRGISLGGGVRWQAGAVVGPLATRADANGVQRPITPLNKRPTIRGDATYLTDLNFGYKRRIWNNRVNWEIQCNISNVLNNRDRVLNNIWGNGMPRYYRWLEPRKITLSSSFGF